MDPGIRVVRLLSTLFHVGPAGLVSPGLATSTSLHNALTDACCGLSEAGVSVAAGCRGSCNNVGNRAEITPVLGI